MVLTRSPALMPGNAWPHRLHGAGCLVSKPRGQRGRLEIHSGAEHALRPVQSERLHLQAHLAPPRFGRGEIVDLEDFGTTGLVKAHDLCHRGSPLCWLARSLYQVENVYCHLRPEMLQRTDGWHDGPPLLGGEGRGHTIISRGRRCERPPPMFKSTYVRQP